MNKLTAVVLLALVAALAILPSATHAQAEPYVAGSHYTELRNPVKTRDPAKIEVIEVFWYGCGFCFSFQPLIENWAANAADDVDFVRMPAMWNQLMGIHAQAFYTAEALDALDIMHEHIFTAYHIERNRLQSEDQIADLFADHGIAEADFRTTFNSFGVRTRVNQVRSRMPAYQVQSTPNIVVNGKYLVTTNQTTVLTQHDMLAVVDFLVQKERRELPGGGE